MKQRILIIDDDADLCRLLRNNLEQEGYFVCIRHDGAAGLEELRSGDYQLVVLDIMLPLKNGYEVLGEIREKSFVPVLMLTARDTEIDEVKALNLGVDDYMKKPFSLAVLKARVKNLLRRKESTDFIKENDILIDKYNCRIYRGGQEIKVTSIEYRLLRYLIENKGHILSKEQILSYIWDADGKYVDDNIVSVNIRRLRMKIEENLLALHIQPKVERDNIGEIIVMQRNPADIALSDNFDDFVEIFNFSVLPPHSILLC